MASEKILGSANGRQWVLSTALHFLGTDFNGVADDTNDVHFDVRPGTLFLRGTLHTLVADTSGESNLNIGIAGALAQLDGPIPTFSTITLPILTYGNGVAPLVFQGSVLYYPEATTLYVTHDSGTTPIYDGEYILQLEYIVKNRSNEVYG